MKFSIALIATVLAASTAYADQYVNGHYRRDGTYVQGHYRSSPDGNSYNNWSTKGNVNPYTGRAGQDSPSYGGYGSYGNSSRRSNSNCVYGLC